MSPQAPIQPQPGPLCISATAPGKAILIGEHAVVYGRPAIAIPIRQTVATATVTDRLADGTAAAATNATPHTTPPAIEATASPRRGPLLSIYAQDIDRWFYLDDLDSPAEPDRMGKSDTGEEPLVLVARRTLLAVGYAAPPGWTVTLHSRIPMASGMGSGAALCAALVRGLWQMAAAHNPTLGPPDPKTVSAIVYAAEEIYHGTPSGIDNTVVAFDRPVWFRRGNEPQVLAMQGTLRLAVADSGEPGSTRTTVAHVRRLHQESPQATEQIFDSIGGLAQTARNALETGKVEALGPLFDANHAYLQQLGVSTPRLDQLVDAARRAGALGAKLSGGGGGGNMIALVDVGNDGDNGEKVRRALLAAGASNVILTQVSDQVSDQVSNQAPNQVDPR